MVYVNYGRVEDFDLLRDGYGIDVRNKTVILRYGKLYRGNKVCFLFSISLILNERRQSFLGQSPYLSRERSLITYSIAFIFARIFVAKIFLKRFLFSFNTYN